MTPAGRVLPLLLGALALGGCANTFERLAQVGQAPDLSPIENPVAELGYRPVTLPMPAVEPPPPVRLVAYASANSAREDLNPTVLVLATLLPITSRLRAAAFSPESPC